MSSCKLTLDFDVTDCIDLDVSGVSGKIYFLNYSEWLTATKTEDATTKEVSTITLTEVGAKAVSYELPATSPVPSTDFVQNSGGKSGWTHTLQFFVPSKAMNLKADLAGKVNFGRVVAIVVLDSSEVAAIYGSDCGMQISSWVETPADATNGGGFVVTMATNPTGLENMPAITFKSTDRATTLAALEALKTAVI